MKLLHSINSGAGKTFVQIVCIAVTVGDKHRGHAAIQGSTDISIGVAHH